MTHFLNYKYYLDRTAGKPAVFKRSENLKKALDELRSLDLKPLDEKGVFKRLPRRKLTRMYMKADLLLGRSKPSRYVRPKTPIPRTNPVYYVFDEASQEWLLIDSRGKILTNEETLDPKWEFVGYSPELRSIIYASKDSIFYPIKGSPLILRKGSEEPAVKHIRPRQGSISGLAGCALNWLTIEGNGKFLCH